MNIVGKIIGAFVEQNRPLTYQQLYNLLSPVKDRYLQEVLVALQYFRYVQKLIFHDVNFYILTCPYYGTPRVRQFIPDWLDYQQKLVLIMKTNKL